MRDPGSSFASAQKINVPFIPLQSNPKRISNSVSATDKIDTYRFKLNRSGDFNLALDKLRSDVDVLLLNKRGRTIASSKNLGKDSEFISIDLKSGVYFVKVLQKSGKSRYRLTVSTEESDATSPGQIRLVGVSEDTFNATSNIASFQITGANFSTNPLDITVFLNGEEVSDDDLTLSPTSIALPPELTEGRNQVELYALDTEGRELYSEATLWAGSRTLNTLVTNALGQPIANAIVTAKLGDEQTVQVITQTNAQGQAIFSNLPNRTIALETLTTDNQFGFLATTGNAGEVELKLTQFKASSAIRNNDFSLGTSGWDIGTASVQIAPHQENISSSRRSLARLFKPRSRASTSSDLDLILNTQGEGVQTISRTFDIDPGTTHVALRYRFITTEVPGGYFGSRFNDYFKVTARSKKGSFVSDGNSMNGLGLGAFSPFGATTWRELSIPVNKAGDTVQVELAVANVADGALDSQLVLDRVDTKPLTIEKLDLNDIDNTNLRFLSTGQHSYFGGKTRLNGTIQITGDPKDSLKSLVLEVVQKGQVVATGELATAVKSSLLNQVFGKDGKVEINASKLLFEIASGQTTGVDTTQNVSLRVKATSSKGKTATKDFGSFPVLVQYKGTNRYGQRDPNRGGDDWIKPTVAPVLEHFSTIDTFTFGDMSNMNGGDFTPDHKTHQNGTSVDGHFPGYNNRDAETAARIIRHLNDPTYGSRIRLVYVTYSRVDTDPFWTAIKDVVLNDGRQAKQVITPIRNHTTHFHWEIIP